MQKKYAALRIIAVLNKIGAVFIAGFGLLIFLQGAVVTATREELPAAKGYAAVLSFVILFGLLIFGLVLWASAELIYVFLDIEENTRRSIRPRSRAEELLID